MLRRLGFVGRLMAIVFLSLIALWVVGVGWTYVSQTSSRPRIFLPLPKQAAAIVRLLESSDPKRRSDIVEATNSDSLTVTLSDTLPVTVPDQSRLPTVEWMVARYVDVLGDREIVASFPEAPGARLRRLWWGPSASVFNQPLKLAIQLETGGYVVFETHGELSRRLFGLPPGFWVGVLGALIGIAAIVAVAREARPLTELARAVSRFGDEATPVAISARGAPEIAKLIHAVNEMQARISALVKGRTMFFGAVSHDLKTYITRLRLRAETIPDEEQQTRAVRDLDDMTLLIDDALAVARSSIVSGQRETVNLVDLIKDDIDRRPKGSVELCVGREATEIPIGADVLAVRRLFANLVDNAIQFGTLCRVTLSTEGRFAIALVDDDGPGIPESERLAVLEPFYRLETSRSRATGGTGLGLAIAKEIVTAHGGTIRLDTSPLGGTRVRIELPSCATS
jgi:two-component system osmolarity sensor histidine kinase EnvZ